MRTNDMKKLLTYTLLCGLLITGVTVKVMADDSSNDYAATTTTSTVTTTTKSMDTTYEPLVPSVQLGTDADYNLDYDKNNGKDCMVNKQIDLTPEQRSKLRNSRIKLEQHHKEANLSPNDDPNLQGQKVEAVKQVLSEHQFRQYLILREQCA